jgi:hypothetical protein
LKEGELVEDRLGLDGKWEMLCSGLGLTIDPEIDRVVRGHVAAVAVLPPYLYSVVNIDEEDILCYSGCQAPAGS